MNSYNIDIGFKKASILTCLFLFCTATIFGQQFKFDSTSWKGYQLLLDLDFDSTRQLIPSPQTAADHYVLGLADALELLLTEDRSKYEAYEEAFDRRVEAHVEGSSEDRTFLAAELNLQWAFVYLKFGHELDAAKHFRQSYQLTQSLRKKSPGYQAIQKTNGMLQIMIGSIPQKYNWILALLGLEGNTTEGIKDLEALRSSASEFAMEAGLILSLCQGYIFQKPEEGLAAVQNLIKAKPQYRLMVFVAASLALKNSQSETAFNLLSDLMSQPGKPLAYGYYLQGEVLLHKEDYGSAINAYEKFLTAFKGVNNTKDAAYKISLCQHLMGNLKARSLFEKAKGVGDNNVESDKAAARVLASNEFPNVKLSKIRYATDGGYYDRARELVALVSASDLSTKKDQVEFYYRRARIDHLTGRFEPSKLFYRQVIDMAGNEDWYFTPNSCLQLGYILVEQGKRQEAREYFLRALTYNHHEYKNSIDSKARSALNQLKK